MSKSKQRRSRRVPKSERIMLNITSPVSVQEMVSTILVSGNGAKVLSKRRLMPESRGTALFISAGREVPCRVAWQKAPGANGQMETGLEIYPQGEFWDVPFQEAKTAASAAEASVSPAPARAAASPVRSKSTGPDFRPVAAKSPGTGAGATQASVLDMLEKARAGTDSELFPAQLWSGLVDALEAKGVFTRDELIGMLRKLGQG